MFEQDAVDLGSLMTFIEGRFPFTGERYPELAILEKDPVFAISIPGKSIRKRFGLTHLVFHFNKTLGKLASELEAEGHGEPLNEQELKEATAKMLVNTLKLASELGLSPKELAQLVSTVMKP